MSTEAITSSASLRPQYVGKWRNWGETISKIFSLKKSTYPHAPKLAGEGPRSLLGIRDGLEVGVLSSGNNKAAELVVLMGLAQGGVVGTSGKASKTLV
ncbi:hypothetical protein E2C01_009250 [Portunus trituberculatus]|uniref:Uncharacterized protein n=1 Tax=Portunus trituberculatus TaxID=210409 RepID=A0A5B7D5E5_PORTR|nr:hypothetical protein [Portunus trituberculatus]